jgi:hypothetical protein
MSAALHVYVTECSYFIYPPPPFFVARWLQSRTNAPVPRKKVAAVGLHIAHSDSLDGQRNFKKTSYAWAQRLELINGNVRLDKTANPVVKTVVDCNSVIARFYVADKS